jgi:hypothetical protein
MFACAQIFRFIPNCQSVRLSYIFAFRRNPSDKKKNADKHMRQYKNNKKDSKSVGLSKTIRAILLPSPGVFALRFPMAEIDMMAAPTSKITNAGTHARSLLQFTLPTSFAVVFAWAMQNTRR